VQAAEAAVLVLRLALRQNHVDTPAVHVNHFDRHPARLDGVAVGAVPLRVDEPSAVPRPGFSQLFLTPICIATP
jgi:hypothetical protein